MHVIIQLVIPQNPPGLTLFSWANVSCMEQDLRLAVELPQEGQIGCIHKRWYRPTTPKWSNKVTSQVWGNMIYGQPHIYRYSRKKRESIDRINYHNYARQQGATLISDQRDLRIPFLAMSWVVPDSQDTNYCKDVHGFAGKHISTVTVCILDSSCVSLFWLILND